MVVWEGRREVLSRESGDRRQGRKAVGSGTGEWDRDDSTGVT